MNIADYSLVYHRYDQLARHCYANTMSSGRGVEYEEFSWQPYKLLEAYALGVRAIEEKSIVRTSDWKRQSGATTVACALMLADKDIVMLASDLPAARHASRMVMSAYNQETKNRRFDVGQSIIHDKVRWTSKVKQDLHGQPLPKLIVVDSDTAYARGRDETIEFINSVGCAVLVLSAPPPWQFI